MKKFSSINCSYSTAIPPQIQPCQIGLARWLGLGAVLLLFSSSVQAQPANILELTTGGASGTDWNATSQWTGNAVPIPADNYVLYTNTAAGLGNYYGVNFGLGRLRTPTDGNVDVFDGGSLTIPCGAELLLKESNGGTPTANIIFSNYNNISYANVFPMIRLSPNQGAETVTLNGTITNLTASYLASDTSNHKLTLKIASTVVGANNLTLVSSAGGATAFDASNTNVVTGNWSGFSGTLNLGNTTIAAVVELNNSAVNVNMALAMPRVNGVLILDKPISVQSFSITNATVAAGTYTPAQLSALGFGGTFSGNGSLTVGFTAPPNLTAAPGSSQVALSWQPVYGAVSYNVKRSTTSGGETTVNNVSSTNYTDTGLVNGTPYFYEVSAVNGSSLESGNSVEASATPVAGPPTTPTWVSVTTANPAQVSLSWTAGGGTTFFLERGTVSGTYTVTNVLSVTNFVDTQVLSGTTYYYVVSSTNIAGASANSIEINATPSAPPFPPTGLTVVDTGSGQVTLSWNGTFGATSYNVKRSTSSGAETTVGNTGGTSYVDSGLMNQTTYYYVVSSVGAGGETNSAEFSIVTGYIVEAATAAAAGTDWNQGSQWTGGNAPAAGASYIVYTNTTGSAGLGSYYGVNFGFGRVRGPADASASTFLGDSLIIPPGSELLLKAMNGGSATANIVFTNYNNVIAAGLYPMVRLSPNQGSETVTLSGTITSATDGYLAADTIFNDLELVIASTVMGTSNITLITSGQNAFSSVNTNLVTGDWSGFSGTLNIGNATIAAVVELDNSAVNAAMKLTMLNTNGTLILDTRIPVASFSIGGNAVPNGGYTAAALANLGYGGYFSGAGKLVVGNNPPVASPNTYTRNGLSNWRILVSNLLTNATDVDGDTLTLASVGTSTNGISLSISGGYVLYDNPNLVDDQFSYTVTDGFGGTSSAVITLTVGSSNGVGGTASGITFAGGTSSMTFAGVPGYTYNVQVSTDLTNWTTIYTTNAPTGGVFQFTENAAPTPIAFYRLMWNGN